jgi:hypothetical protein
MSLTESANELLNSVIEMPFRFAEVAMHDPISAVLIAFGTLFVAGAMGAFGYLTLGAVVDFLSTENATAPPQ